MTARPTPGAGDVWGGALNAWLDETFATKVALIDAAETVTVGPSGTYASISAALAYLGDKKAAYVNGGFTATINLLAGFVMAEQIVLDNVDFGWVNITSVDAEVTVTRSAIPSGQGAWYALRNATTPRISCFFRMDASGTGSAYRLFDIQHHSHIEFGTAASGGGGAVNRVLQVIHGSTCVATSGVTIKDSLDIGVRAANASLVSIPFSTITNNANNGVAASSGAVIQMANSTCTGSVVNISATGGAVVIVSDATLTGAGTGQAISADMAYVYARNSNLTDGGALASGPGSIIDARGCVFGTGDTLRVLEGGVINGTGRTGAGTLTQTANLMTKDGIIWDTAVVSENAGALVASGTGSQTAFTIAHGLGVTPAVYYVVAQNSDSGQRHWVSAADATNLTITFATAPPSGTNNLRFRWYAKVQV